MDKTEACSITHLLFSSACSYPEGGVNSLQTLLVELPLEAGWCWWVAGYFAHTVTIFIISGAEQAVSGSQLNNEM